MDQKKARIRLKICHECLHLHKPFIGQPKCEICGCIARAKALIESEKCPISKW